MTKTEAIQYHQDWKDEVLQMHYESVNSPSLSTEAKVVFADYTNQTLAKIEQRLKILSNAPDDALIY